MREPLADGWYYAIVESEGNYMTRGYINISGGFCIVKVSIKSEKANSVWTTLKNWQMILNHKYGASNKRSNLYTDFRLMFKGEKELIKAIFEVLQ